VEDKALWGRETKPAKDRSRVTTARAVSGFRESGMSTIERDKHSYLLRESDGTTDVAQENLLKCEVEQLICSSVRKNS
jgi:hypothetical protein